MNALSVVSKTLEITRTLWNIENEMDRATLRLRLTEVIDGLVQAKEALHDAKDRERELMDEIVRLKASFEKKRRLKDENGLLYESTVKGEKKGEPYCNLCYTREGKSYRMRFHDVGVDQGARYECDNCKIKIKTGPNPPYPSFTPRNVV